MSKERLDKILASEMLGSRKEVGKIIRKGLVSVNGKIINKIDYKVDTDIDEILFNNKKLTIKKNVYIMMNKPKGVISASRDNFSRTVLDLVPDNMRKKDMFPAGRLDKDTEGLLIITNDGEFAHNMLSPKKHVYKTYEALVKGKILDKHITAFAEGIFCKDGTKFLPAELKVVSNGENSRVLVKIREGKYHEIKRMFTSISSEVIELKRLQIGGLCLDESLKSGECKEMSEEEVKSVFC